MRLHPAASSTKNQYICIQGWSVASRKMYLCEESPESIVQLLYDCIVSQFSVAQIEYPLGGSNKRSSHVYFLLQVFWIILLFDINVVLMLPWWHDVKIIQCDVTIVVPWQLSTGSKHDYLVLLPLVGKLFEVLRIVLVQI